MNNILSVCVYSMASRRKKLRRWKTQDWTADLGARRRHRRRWKPRRTASCRLEEPPATVGCSVTLIMDVKSTTHRQIYDTRFIFISLTKYFWNQFLVPVETVASRARETGVAVDDVISVECVIVLTFNDLKDMQTVRLERCSRRLDWHAEIKTLESHEYRIADTTLATVDNSAYYPSVTVKFVSFKTEKHG